MVSPGCQVYIPGPPAPAPHLSPSPPKQIPPPNPSWYPVPVFLLKGRLLCQFPRSPFTWIYDLSPTFILHLHRAHPPPLKPPSFGHLGPQLAPQRVEKPRDEMKGFSLKWSRWGLAEMKRAQADFPRQGFLRQCLLPLYTLEPLHKRTILKGR